MLSSILAIVFVSRLGRNFERQQKQWRGYYWTKRGTSLDEDMRTLKDLGGGGRGGTTH